MSYEYIRIKFDWGDLAEMNALSSVGWRVTSTERMDSHPHLFWALMERPLQWERER